MIVQRVFLLQITLGTDGGDKENNIRKCYLHVV